MSASRWYALCDGEDLPFCCNCQRLADNNPQPISEYQAWLSPHTDDRKCIDYMALRQPVGQMQ